MRKKIPARSLARLGQPALSFPRHLPARARTQPAAPAHSPPGHDRQRDLSQGGGCLRERLTHGPAGLRNKNKKLTPAPLSSFQVTDNSGAKLAQVINQSGKSWGIGNIITVAIKRSQPRSKIAAGTVRRERGREQKAGGRRLGQSRRAACGGASGLPCLGMACMHHVACHTPTRRLGASGGGDGGACARALCFLAPAFPWPPPPAPTELPPPSSPLSLLPFPLCAQVQKAVITETVKELRRPDGSSIGFARNACVLVNSKGAPLGTRVLGFAAHELRARGLMKVLSLTARVL